MCIPIFGGKDEHRFFALAPEFPSTRIRKLAWRTTPPFRVKSLYWSQLRRCRHDVFFPVVASNRPLRDS
jgi:hypothetical protein